MAFEVVISPRAFREYKKLPEGIKDGVRIAVDSLKHEPLKGGSIKKLQGALREYHRYRIGDYRVLYSVDIKEKKVYVDSVRHRRDVYKKAGR